MAGSTPLVVSSRPSMIGRWVRAFVDFVLPPACTICKCPGTVLCSECAATVTWVFGPVCDRCGRITEQPVTACWSCRQKPSTLSQIRAAVWFEGAVPELIHSLKYQGGFALANLLGRYMSEAWPTWAEPIDFIVPVPLHPEREKKTGIQSVGPVSPGFKQPRQPPLERTSHSSHPLHPATGRPFS